MPADVDAKFESSRGVIIDQLLKCRVWGRSGTHGSSNAEGQQLGDTLRASRRRSRESNEPGRPGELNLGTTGRSRDRGNSVSLGETQGRIDRRSYRSSEETGQPEDSNTVTRKGGIFEATRSSTGRYNRTTDESGATRGNSRGANQEQGFGETRSLDEGEAGMGAG